jgi:hypothetical protein
MLVGADLSKVMAAFHFFDGVDLFSAIIANIRGRTVRFGFRLGRVADLSPNFTATRPSNFSNN